MLYQGGCIYCDINRGLVPETRRGKRVSALLPLFSGDVSYDWGKAILVTGITVKTCRLKDPWGTYLYSTPPEILLPRGKWVERVQNTEGTWEAMELQGTPSLVQERTRE